MARGTLRIYLGAAPGVGKTFAMLGEGRRAAERGHDVVVGLVESHGRPQTEAQVGELEVIPRKVVAYRGSQFEEMDIDAVLARRPETVLVDELAHTDVPGGRHAKRWEDVDELLAAGINVISTVNIQHLESLNDVVREITGSSQRETVPDGVVRAADQIELVDMSPESLRRRMAHGNIYRPERVDAAMSSYFREGNLAALRELALLWVADRVDEGLKEYRERHGITGPWETRERVVVALTGSPDADRTIRRGARMAARGHAELVGVHVRPADGLAAAREDRLTAHRQLLGQLGGRYAEVAGADVAAALVSFARAENATQLLLGSTHRSRWAELTRGSVVNDVIRRAGNLDVHVISSASDVPDESPRRLPRLPAPHHLAALSRRRTTLGWVLAVVAMPALATGLVPLRPTLGPTGALPELLLGVVIVAAVGGLLPGLVGAMLAFGLADWYFITPLHTLTVTRAGDAVALVSFLVVAAAVSALIDRLARRGIGEARAKAEAEALARLAGSALLSGNQVLTNLIDQLRVTFALDAVAVLEPVTDGTDSADGAHAPEGAWRVRAATGRPVPTSPEEGQLSAPLAAGSVLVLAGRGPATDERPVLAAFIAQLIQAQQQLRLATVAAEAESLADANELRAALLAAVSHDLRTPLASIKACVTSLLSEDVTWDPAAIRAFDQTIEIEADRLTALVDNLLDMSRLQAGALLPATRAVAPDEVVFSALATLSVDTSTVRVDVAESLPAILADPPLLERAVANLVANALAWSPPDEAVRVDATVSGGRLELHVVDRGPGIPVAQREGVFRPFQRLGDTPQGPTDGVGLGLAVARGFVEAMAGTMALEDTPGGGVTAIIALPLADEAPTPDPAGTGAELPAATVPPSQC
jgi:two-component system sensor histidine kinase KdpD